MWDGCHRSSLFKVTKMKYELPEKTKELVTQLVTEAKRAKTYSDVLSVRAGEVITTFLEVKKIEGPFELDAEFNIIINEEIKEDEG